MSTITEKIVEKRVEKHTEKLGILPYQQFLFRKQHLDLQQSAVREPSQKDEPNRLSTSNGSISGLLPQRKNIQVRNGENLSEIRETQAGLPQGAILYFFLNCTPSTPGHVFTIIQRHLDKLKEWCII